MWVEWNSHNQQDICGNDWVPYFSDRNLDIPQWIRFHISGIHNEATQEQVALKANIVENFIRSSINVDSWSPELNSYIYDEIFSHLYTWVSESRGTLEDIDFPDFVLRDIFIAALEHFALEKPEDFSVYLSSDSHEATFWNTLIDISLLVEHVQDKSIWEYEQVQNDAWSLLPSTSPESRTDLPRELQLIMSERSENQFDVLEREWFSRPMRNFILIDLFPNVMGEDFEFWDQHIERLQKFCLFLIDMETTRWTQTVNMQWSSWSWFTQLLNEAHASRETGEFNSIDTRLREAVKFYSDNDLSRLNSFTTINTENIPRADWVQELWLYNENPRNGNEFTIDSELKLLLIFLAQRNPENLRNIILWNNTQIAAMNLYQTHHTNAIWVWAHQAANMRLRQMLMRHFI